MLVGLVLKMWYTFEAWRPFADMKAVPLFTPRALRSDYWPRDVAYFDWMRWLWNRCVRTDSTFGAWKVKHPFATYIRGGWRGLPRLLSKQLLLHLFVSKSSSIFFSLRFLFVASSFL